MPADKSSPIWEHFVKLEKGKAWCRYCKKEVATTDHATGNLIRHLSVCNVEAYAEFDKIVVENKKKENDRKRRLEVKIVTLLVNLKVELYFLFDIVFIVKLLRLIS